jgi:NitT/TauT family transport system ATP-binding protein
VVEFSDVNKRFGEKTVLSGFTHRFAANKTTVIRGESGRGKTTLLRLAAGLELPDIGIVTVAGRVVFVFQEDRLLPQISAVKNLRICSSLSVKQAEDLLKEFSLHQDDITAPVRELSGGMARRVALARGLAANGDVLLLDEPFRGLDDDNRKRAADTVKRHAVGKTILLVTHDIDDMALFPECELFDMD